MVAHCLDLDETALKSGIRPVALVICTLRRVRPFPQSEHFRMNPNAVCTWLKKKKNTGFAGYSLCGLLALALGGLVVFFTFWFTYAVVFAANFGVSAILELALNKQFFLSHQSRLFVSGIFVALLFLQQFRTSRWRWGDYPKGDYSSAYSTRGHFGAIGTILLHPAASANIIADLLLIGPRLIDGARVLIFQSLQMRRLDEPGCAQLLAFLHARGGVVPYEELKEAGWEPWFSQLRHIEGVVFLQHGLNLTQDLKTELNQLQRPPIKVGSWNTS